MKFFLVLNMVFIALMTFAQKDELIFSDSARAKIEDASGSAFMQYSNFIPSNFDELLISISGSEVVDSILLQAKHDTLAQSGAQFFDEYIRKDFALESIYSPALHFFSSYGLYDPNVIKSAIICAYKKYLEKESIEFRKIKRRVLKKHRKANSKAQGRFREQIREVRRHK